MKKTKAQHDSAWKGILEIYLPQALEICFPELYDLIDWKREWLFLDKELQSIGNASKTGKRYLDMLARVYLKSGEQTWVLLHFEIELRPTIKFPERMFIYGIRLYSKYRKPIASCVFLADNTPFRTAFYEISLASSRMRHDFMTCKIIDFEKKRNELEISANPFATVILFHLDALAAKKQSQKKRLLTKISLTKRLYGKGFRREEIMNIFRFLDFSIALNDELELQYQDEIHKLEESKHMAYISSPLELLIEKRIKKRVEEQAWIEVKEKIKNKVKREVRNEVRSEVRNENREEIALRLLERKYPDDEIILVTELTKEKLQTLREKFVMVNALPI